MYMYLPDMKFLWAMLLLGQLYTDDNTNDNDDDDDDTNDDDNNTRWTNHDCIGSLACMPNEPKSQEIKREMPSKSYVDNPHGE